MRITLKQLEAIKRIASSDACTKIEVSRGTFDLPKGYLCVTISYDTGPALYGGISELGEVST